MTTTSPLAYPVDHPESATLEIKELVDHWRDEEGNLIMILHSIQDKHGYVPREMAMVLANALGVSLARIYEVITFYHYFKLVPPGRHNVSICTGTACYLKGSANILSQARTSLGIKEGETTEDREFHLETVRCIGCCGMSPALSIDGRAYGRIRSADLPDILAKTRQQSEEVA